MDLDQTLLADSWRELEALENETKLLLESIRGKPKGIQQIRDKKNPKDRPKADLKHKAPKPSKTTRSKRLQSSEKTRQLNELESTRALFPDSRMTIEILDDASPDGTPREDDEAANFRKTKVMKQKLVEMQDKEKQYRKLEFDDEKLRLLLGNDTFVPGPDISIADINKERQRIARLEESARLKYNQMQSEVLGQRTYLLQDKSALAIQRHFRGYLGRQKFVLTQSLKTIRAADRSGDWVQVSDPQSGDVWYYNKSTGQSQWGQPSALTKALQLHGSETANTGSLPRIASDADHSSESRKASSSSKPKTAGKMLEVSMSLPSLEAMSKSRSGREDVASSPKKTKKALSFKDDTDVDEKEASKAVHLELGIDKLTRADGLLAPDGAFKPNLRTVVLDALVQSRFDSVSTVIADDRWYEADEFVFDKTQTKKPSKGDRAATGEEKAFVPAEEDVHRRPLVSQLVIRKKQSPGVALSMADYGKAARTKEGAANSNPADAFEARDFAINSIAHTGFDAGLSSETMCFGCWSSGLQRKCELHQGDTKLKPSQTMLLCRNWDLDVMRRRYRSEEIQEIFLHKESSLRFDPKFRKFSTVTEQKHPIYRSRNEMNDKFNNRLFLFEKIKFWLRSIAEELRVGNAEFPPSKSADISSLLKWKRSVVSHSRVTRYTKLHSSEIPVAPITGYSLAERRRDIQFLYKHFDAALSEEVDLILAYPTPKPQFLYLPREYHLSLPRTIPMPKPAYGDGNPALRVLPNNTFIPDDNSAAWVEKMAAANSRDCIQAAKAQVKAFTPITITELLQRTKNPVPCTIKSATMGRKPCPGNIAIGGLSLELLVYQLVSTFIPVQYGNFMVMDKGTVSPGISQEVTISFQSIVMPPIVQHHVIRPVEHPLNYRRAPTITLNSNISPLEGRHFYGINRPEQTGEKSYYGFRTTAWAPMLLTYAETDPQVFVPGQGVVSLNAPRANTSHTTHADSTYPFCEPSTRDNSTLDFYHLLLTGVVSAAKAQVFTALTIQEPGQFLKACDAKAPMGHVLVNIYRSWAFTQNDTIQEFRTDDGISYWYHRKTGQTFWERPLYEPEEKSPLEGGTVLDMHHPEEPLTMSKSAEGATRRYTQGEFRGQMLAHIETKKDAVNRRRAASVTLQYAKQRGIVPAIAGMESMVNHAQSSAEMGSKIDFNYTNSSMMNNPVAGNNSNDVEEMGDQVQVDRTQPQAYPPVSSGGHALVSHSRVLVSGGKLDEGSHVIDGIAFDPTSRMINTNNNIGGHATQHADHLDSSMLGMNTNIGGGLDPNMISNLSNMIGGMMTNLMMMDSSNPQNMIQLGLGMGMALMSSGAMNNLIGAPTAPTGPMVETDDRSSPQEEEGGLWAGGNHFDKLNTHQGERTFPALTEDEASVLSASTHNRSSVSRVSVSKPMSMFINKSEPIGLPYPSAVYAADKVLDHFEEQAQRVESAEKVLQPLNTMQIARNLKINTKASDTPDVAPPKALTLVRASNRENEVREEQLLPLLAYPELSTNLPDGVPTSFDMIKPAGLGSSFVSPDERDAQQFVSGATHLRRTVMPLPVGFFEAIEAKHVAQQTADYLPQVPNMPQSRNIGRVRPRSAAADWLMINFDPWSAGKNPLGTEYVRSLLEKAEKFIKGGVAGAADELQRLQKNTVDGAYTKVEDEEGLAQQRADIARAEALSNDFKKLCSLCRHSKFTDAEELVNQPDWTVPIDYQDEQGNTLLHIVAQNGNRRLVKLCIRRGANLNLQNLTGQTSLHFAYGYGYAEVGDYLLSKGADDSIRNKDNLTCYEGLGAKELEYFNTWGYDPSTNGRFQHDDRWTTMLTSSLNKDVDVNHTIRYRYHVVVEGLNGRTTIFSDASRIRDYDSDGRPLLVPLLHSHKPISLVIIALCVNDHKVQYGASPADLVRGVETLVLDVWRASNVGDHSGRPPAVLVLGPPMLVGNELNRSWGFEPDVEERSKATIQLLEKVLPALSERSECSTKGPVHLLQLSHCAVVSAIDGIHFEADQQPLITTAVADAVRRILQA